MALKNWKTTIFVLSPFAILAAARPNPATPTTTLLTTTTSPPVSTATCVATCDILNPFACGTRATCQIFDPKTPTSISGKSFCVCQAGYRGTGLNVADKTQEYHLNWINDNGDQTHRVFVNPAQDCLDVCQDVDCSEVQFNNACATSDTTPPHDIPSGPCVTTCNLLDPFACGTRATCQVFNPNTPSSHSGQSFCVCQAGYRATGVDPTDVSKEYHLTWLNTYGDQTHRVFVNPGQACTDVCSDNRCSEVPLKDSCL